MTQRIYQASSPRKSGGFTVRVSNPKKMKKVENLRYQESIDSVL
jgi:hypothetical protein